MFEAFISILVILSATSPHLTGGSRADGKDGSNFYKDYYLRGRTDDDATLLPVSSDKILYFYRTPLHLYPGVQPVVLDQDNGKRSGNTFKNHMLSKDTWVDAAGYSSQKRSSKATISLLMANKPNPYQILENIMDENQDIAM